MANDPNTIQYVIQEDGFWYIASKEKNPYVPYITVSAKGVANGLSNEPNDGADFGPDSYDPTSTATPPYTQTSGIQEWANYCSSLGYVVPALLNTADSNAPYELYTPVILDSKLSGWTLKGANKQTTIIQLNFNASDYAIALDGQNTSMHYDIGNFAIDFNGYTTGNGFLGFPQPSETVIRGYIHDIVPLNANGQYAIYGTNSEGCLIERINGQDNASDIGSLYWTASAGEINISRCVFWNMNLNGLSVVNYDVTINNTYTENQNGGKDTFIACYWNGYSGANGYSIEYTATGGAPNALILIGTILANNYSGSNPAVIYSNTTPVELQLVDSTIQYNGSGTVPLLYTPSTGSINVQLRGGSLVFPSVTMEVNANGTLTPIENRGTLPANPPVSGTVYQLGGTGYYISATIYLPVYATTAGTAGYVTVALGGTNSPTPLFTKYVSGDTSSTAPEIVSVRVPLIWYYSFTGSGVTFGTATVVWG